MDKLLKEAFVTASIKFPSALFGMFCTFSILVILDTAVPSAAVGLMNFFEPALLFIQRWLPLFYVPSLVILPLAVRDIPAASGLKIIGILVGGWLASLCVAGYTAIAVRNIVKTEMIPAEPMSKPPPFSGIEVSAWSAIFVSSFVGAYLYPTLLGTAARTCLPFLLSATVLGYMIGTRLPSGLKMLFHPIICCAISADLAAFAFGYISKSGLDPVLGYYLTKVSTNPGAGDILMGFLGSVIISFAFSMFKQRKLVKRHAAEIFTSIIVATVFSLYSTALVGRLVGLEKTLTISILPRCITVALALSIVSLFEGTNASLTAAVVVLTGLVGANFVQFVLDKLQFRSIASLYAWLVFTPFVRTPYYAVPSLGCQEDNEGSWSIGVFYGTSPFSLLPIEDKNVWKNESAAWPVANPVITCVSPSEAGYPSNFVADPFLYIQDDVLYLFYETKNSVTMQGDIGVSRSTDNGVTWKQLGTALDENWHLSYPYVFNFNGQIYMMPESSEKGELRLYRAVSFPLQWKLEKVLIKKPLVDSFLVKHDTKYWIFGSDHSSFGAIKNGRLEIWYGDSPLGPWIPHKKNPIYNTERSSGARNGGRPFVYDGSLYRVGQDCGETYGKRIRIFKVEVLTEHDYKEVEVPSGFIESSKGRNVWNGVRYHHLDVQQLGSGEWIAFMDGDRVSSGHSVDRFIVGCASVLAVVILVLLLGVLTGAVKCLIPLNWCPHNLRKRSDALLSWERPNTLSSKLRQFSFRLNRVHTFLRVWIKPNTVTGKLVLFLIFVSGVVLMCNGVTYIYGGSGAEEPYLLNGQYSQFTMLTMTYDARLWNLNMYVKHYSRCSSVKEIVVVWNKGKAPEPSEFDSAVPVRIRVEKLNSLNNRFKIDPLIKTRAVLELDDDIMMTCDDIERGFKVWREHPDRIVGFYPRLVDGFPLKYRAEKYARKQKGYNMILTGAAFMDTQLAFRRYWSEEAMVGRSVVDKIFNCEDVLLNYLYANASSFATVEYVKPAWAIDTSKFSGAAISRDTDVHYQKRSECLSKFAELYGSLANRKLKFDQRNDGWDV